MRGGPGYHPRQRQRTRRLVRQAAMEGDITKEAMTVFGRYYRVDWAIPTRGNAGLRTMWEIAPGEEVPRLISAFMHS